MGVLKIKEENLDKKTSTIKAVLEHFDRLEKKYENSILEQISAASDNAFGDEILFEEFENWTINKDDDVFIYLINHYWENLKKSALPNNGDITGHVEKISGIKEKAKSEIGKKFAHIVNELCTNKKLKTYKEISDFLDIGTEERVRVLLDGKHKPQRATILNVAEKFNVDPNELMKKIL